MKIEQATPNERALKGLGLGDLLRHFKVTSDNGKEYYTAVLSRAEDRTGRFRTTCTCWDSFVGFADADRAPVCKHADAVIGLMHVEAQAEAAKYALETATIASKEVA